MDTREGIDDPDGEIYQRRGRQANPGPAYGWSSSGKIIVPVVPFSDPNVTKPIEEIGPLQIRFPKPGYHTVQFNLVQRRPAIDESPLNPLVVRAGAEIIWSVKGNAVRRQINVTDGTSLSGTGESANITVFDDSFVNFITDVEYEYDISVQVTPGTRPNIAGSQPPIKNGEIGFYGVDAVNNAFAAGGEFDIVNAAVPPFLVSATNIFIPQNCGINSYHLNISVTDPAKATPTGGQILVYQNAGGPGVFQTIGSVNYDSINQWNPISPGAKIITIVNGYEVSNPSHLKGFILFGVDG